VFVITPSVNETAQHLEIELELDDGSVINTNHVFEYRGNPRFTDIRPRDHLTLGGTQVTVSGDNLDSVAKPRITVTIVVTRFYNETHSVSSMTEADSEPCKLPEAQPNGSQILCRLPVVSLPKDLSEQLEINESGKVNITEGPGVAAFVSSDGRTHADVYVGLKLDGFRRFQNISSVDPSVKIQFSLPPVVHCPHLIEFDPNKQEVISIYGRHLQRGSRLVDFDIRLGVAACVPASMTDDRVDCRPPTKKPDNNETFCDGDTLSLRVMIGFSHHQCSCVRYALSLEDDAQNNISIIIGLACTAGFLLLLIIASIVMIIVLSNQIQQQGKRPEAADTYEVPQHGEGLSNDYDIMQLNEIDISNAIYENSP